MKHLLTSQPYHSLLSVEFVGGLFLLAAVQGSNFRECSNVLQWIEVYFLPQLTKFIDECTHVEAPYDLRKRIHCLQALPFGKSGCSTTYPNIKDGPTQEVPGLLLYVAQPPHIALHTTHAVGPQSITRTCDALHLQQG